MNVAVYKIGGQGSVYVRYYLDCGHGQGSCNLSSPQGQGERGRVLRKGELEREREREESESATAQSPCSETKRSRDLTH